MKHRVVMSDICERPARSHPADTRVEVVIETVHVPHLAGCPMKSSGRFASLPFGKSSALNLLSEHPLSGVGRATLSLAGEPQSEPQPPHFTVEPEPIFRPTRTPSME